MLANMIAWAALNPVSAWFLLWLIVSVPAAIIVGRLIHEQAHDGGP